MTIRRGMSVVALSLAACTGSIGQGEGVDVGGAKEPEQPESPRAVGGAGASNPGPGVPAPAPTPGTGSVGARPLLRLTPFEFHNTVRDLLGVTPAATSFETEIGEHGFEISVDVTAVVAATMQEQGEEVAALAVKNIARLVPCVPATGDAACAGTFIRTFGRRAFRRPLLPAEQASFEALYATARNTLGYDFTGAVRVLIAAMLQSPQFNYHWELTGPAQRSGGLVTLSPPEIASRLSYFLWASTPDDELLAAAESGGLSDAAGIARQARRLLAHPRARTGLVDVIARQWLHLDRAKGVFKQLPQVFSNGRTGPAMAAESVRFIEHVLFEVDGKIKTLLTAPYTFVNEDLARVYGTPVTGKELRKVDLDPQRRAGLLTQGSFLAVNAGAAETSPVKRGHALVTDVLCVDLPPAPADVPPLPPAGPTAKTMRTRSEQHAKDPACAACHRYLDPPGFAFEHYDAAGGYRTLEGKEPIDASGTVTVAGKERSFANAVDMMNLIATSPEVEGCWSRHLVRYLLGRPELSGEEASITSATQALRTAGGDVRELLVTLTQSRLFTNRIPSPGEVTR